jgi:deoxyribodipyrimidine photo-lyase
MLAGNDKGVSSALPAWRDFYTSILANFPRVSMGRPFNEKFADVIWESVNDSDSESDIVSTDEEEGEGKINTYFKSNGKGKGKAQEDEPGDKTITNFERWKNGKTGYPIVDAAMRCANEMGWMHNRMRMITAMFLCKHLMLDWREGERVSSMSQ